MRLSRWRANAPFRDALGSKVTAVLEPVLTSLGAGADPTAWVLWGADPEFRYTVLVPCPDGLLVCQVRPNVAAEGPRVNAKLVRWSRAQLGELAMETQGGQRIASFQVEGQVMRGADHEADEVAAFARILFCGVDGRPMPALPEPRTRGSAKATASRKAAGATAKRATGPTTGPRAIVPANGARPGRQSRSSPRA